MRGCVLAGPSLGPTALEGITLLPPAARGDVYRAVRQGFGVIGLVDGYFDGVPAVAHKEILWALKEGVHVLGAASMGALRAAELAVYGMRGVGEVFRAYATGEIEGDDEVAVLHGPAETGWLGLSEAMVNVRATVAAAQGAGVLDGALAARVVEVAGELFYKERRWEAVLARLEGEVAERFAAWLPAGRVDRKRADALLLVEEVRDLIARGEPLPAPGFAFEPTQIWEDLVREVEEERSALDQALLAGLGGEPEIRERALLRLLARRVADGPVERAEVRRAVERLRVELGLLRRAELGAWLAARGVDEAWLLRRAEDEVLLEMVTQEEEGLLERLCLDELRLRGDYPEQVRRALLSAQERGEEGGCATGVR